MRFQCRMGDDYRAPSFLAPAVVAVPPAAPVAPRRAQHSPGKLAVVAVLTGGALLTAAGCAVMEPDFAKKRWTVEPTLQVSHAGQTSASHYERGRHHDALQQWSRAIEAYRQAIAADTRNVEAYNALGVALARNGQIELAEATLRQAIALAPERAHMRSNLGYVLLLEELPEEAIFHLRAALNLDESDKVAAINLRDALARAADARRPAASAQAAKPGPVQEVWGVRGATESVSVPPPFTQVDVPLPLSVAPVQSPATPTSDPMALRAATGSRAVDVRVIDKASVGAIARLHATLARDTAPARAAANTDAAAAPARATSHPAMARVEVSNGNGVPGMAAGLGRWLATQGIATDRLTNQRPFRQQHTVVQYREGYEGTARMVVKTMAPSVQAEARSMRHLRSDVRIVLGRDIARTLACHDVERCLAPSGSVAAASR
jgi:tetratricopeptide (TPR) repeat protein